MKINLEAKKRELTGKKLIALREENKIPAVLYGNGIENQNLELDYNTFAKIYEKAGESTLIDLSIDGADPVNVLISDYQNDPVKDKFIHIDFKQVKMDEKITASVSLEYIGESKLVKEEGGTVVHNFDELEIKCLPADLIGEVKVDISKLETFDDVITIADLNISEKIEVAHDPEEVVATVIAAKEEEDPEPVVADEETPEGEEAKEGEQKDGKASDEAISGDKKQNNEEKK